LVWICGFCILEGLLGVAVKCSILLGIVAHIGKSLYCVLGTNLKYHMQKRKPFLQEKYSITPQKAPCAGPGFVGQKGGRRWNLLVPLLSKDPGTGRNKFTGFETERLHQFSALSR
jgi:hypothetical protein